MSDNFTAMLELSDPKTAKLMMNMIEEMIDKKLKKAKFNCMFPAKVISVELDGTLTIEIMEDSTSVSGILNRTGETLIANDYIYVLKINNSNANFVALIKK